MPTYDYVCEQCGHAFEEFQAMSAPVLKKCPKCGKKQLRRLIGIGAGVIFKGSGFYQTDYRSDSYRQAAKNDTSPSSSTSATTASSPTSSSDSKGDSSAKGDNGAKADSSAKADAGPKSEKKTEPKPAAPAGKGKKD